MAVVNHYNIRRVVDIYGSVQGRDLGGISRDIERILKNNNKDLPRGTFVTLKGQVETMRSSYVGLLGGLVFSIVLVYLLIVVNFQSWIDPFIIITALPGALAGIWGTRLLLALGPLDLPRRETIALDWKIALIVVVVGGLLGFVAAAVPAVWSARISLSSLLSASAVRGGAMQRYSWTNNG